MNIRDVILCILFIVAIGVSFWYLFGDSPTLEQTLLVLILTVLYAMVTKIGDIKAKQYFIERRFNYMEKSFIKLVNDFRRLKEAR